MKKIHIQSFIKWHDSQAIMYQCFGDLSSESGLNSAVRKLPPELKREWLLHITNSGNHSVGLNYFGSWLNNFYMAFLHGELAMHFPEPGKSCFKSFGGYKNNHKTTNSLFMVHIKSSEKESTNDECPLSGAVHELWNCPQFENMTISERHESIKLHKLCFSCINEKYLIIKCSVVRQCGIDGCSKSITIF